MNSISKINASEHEHKARAGDIDKAIGSHIRNRRVMLGMSQQQMADHIGVTYQQAHKYERGINRVSAAKLFEIANALDVPVSFFFEASGGTGNTGRSMLELSRLVNSMSETQRSALIRVAQAMVEV